MASVTIREADASDSELVGQLFREYLTWLGEDLTFQHVDDELARPLEGVYQRPNGRVLLAFVDGRPAGCIAAKPLGPWKSYQRVCEMKRLFVRDEFRGLKIGKLLSLRLLSVCQEIGYDVMVLDTLERLTAAVALYRALDFQACDPYYDNPLPTVMYFAKELQATQSS
jgi:GNAT superfamily N-acetyltransferase